MRKHEDGGQALRPINNAQLRCSVLRELAVEDDDDVSALLERVEKQHFHGGVRPDHVQGPMDVPTLVLVVKAAIDNQEAGLAWEIPADKAGMAADLSPLIISYNMM